MVVRQEGKERICEAKLEKLTQVSNWIEQYRKFWDKKFDSLEAYLQVLQKQKRKHGKKS